MATYQLKHRYREEVVVPYVAIGDNCQFFMDNEVKYIITADGVKCIVESCEYKHIFELEEKIKNDYKMDILSFLKRWYDTDKNMQSMEMVVLKLKKID